MKQLVKDEGNVVLEFIGIALFFIVPLIYIAIQCSIAANQFLAVTNSANAAVRTFVVQSSENRSFSSAKQAFVATLEAQHLNSRAFKMRITCSAHPCLRHSNFVSVKVAGELKIRVPLITHLSIPIQASQTLQVGGIQ